MQMSAQPSDLQRRLMSEAQQNLAAVMERVPPWAMLQTWRNQASKATTRDPLPQTPSPSPHPAVRVVNSARCLGLLPLHGEVPEEWAQCNPVQEPPSNLGCAASCVFKFLGLPLPRRKHGVGTRLLRESRNKGTAPDPEAVGFDCDSRCPVFCTGCLVE